MRVIKKHSKFLKIVGILIIFHLIYRFFLGDITSEKIRDIVHSFGVLGPVAYIAIFAFLPITFFPVPILALAGGLSFGFLYGTVYTMIGAMLNSTIMFFMARYLAREAVTEYVRRALPKKWNILFEKTGKKRGFQMIFLLRLIPIVPYNMINYVAGLTEINFKEYSIATFLGILPGTLIFLNIGDKMTDLKSKEFIVSLVLLILLIVVSFVLVKRVKPEEIDNKLR